MFTTAETPFFQAVQASWDQFTMTTLTIGSLSLVESIVYHLYT